MGSPPRWPSAELFFGLTHLAAAACLVLLGRDDAGELPAFAYWFSVALGVLGFAWGAQGIVRMRSSAPAASLLDELHPRWFFLETWKAMDLEAHQERAKRGSGFDMRPVLTLCGGAVFLTVMEYFGGSRTFLQLLRTVAEQSDADSIWRTLPGHPYFRLMQFAWWSGCRVLGYLVLPCVLIKFTGGKIWKNGLETEGFIQHAWIYGFGYYVVFVCVVIVSYTGEFSSYYPFYKLANRSWFDFLCWELLYAAQFLSLEFFFRGWWLKALKPMMGSHAIFVMVVPYCMIHYGKPFPETMAAIVAGLFLGTLAMKTRSIWSGFLIHVSVAISMDMAALLQTRGLPETFFPG